MFYTTDLCQHFSDLLPPPPRLVLHLVAGVKTLLIVNFQSNVWRSLWDPKGNLILAKIFPVN